MLSSDLIMALSVAIAAFSVVAGISAWKREFVGKRKIDLAESVLALFYEVEDAIRAIRNPFAWEEEGRTRKRHENETQGEKSVLDKAYVVVERYEKYEKLFAQFRTLKYRTMATFDRSAGEPFDEIYSVLNEIWRAAYMLGHFYWRQQPEHDMDEQRQKEYQEQRQKCEAIVWNMGEGRDEIGPKVCKAVEKIESLTRGTIIQEDTSV